jgi:hypothetical protein
MLKVVDQIGKRQRALKRTGFRKPTPVRPAGRCSITIRGKKLWQFVAGGQVFDPAVGADGVYFGSADHNVTPQNDCAQTVFQYFLENPTSPDTSCVPKQTIPPFN